VLFRSLVSGIASAAEGYVSKTATGSNSAEVFFPAGNLPMRVISINCTSDTNGGKLTLQSGTVGYTVAKAAASSVTNLVLFKTALASNDSVLLQNAAETNKRLTVTNNSVVTNKYITLRNVLGTNLAVGDVLNERLTVAYTLQAPVAADGTSFLLDTTNGIVSGDVLLLQRPGQLALSKATLDVVSSATNKLATLKTPVVHPVTIGDVVYEQMTNHAAVAATIAYNAVSIHVTSTNGFANGDLVYIRSGGNTAVRTIATVATTNITLTVAAGFALAANDDINCLTSTTYAAIYPALEGDRTLVLNVATGLASNDVVVVASTGYAPWSANLSGVPSSTKIYTVTTTGAFGVAAPAGSVLHELSATTCTLALAAAAADFAVVANVATSLAAGDVVAITPATGGVFENIVNAAGTDYALSTVSFSATLGAAMAAGDSVYVLGNTATLPIGNATVREDSESIFAVDRGRPLRAYLTGSNACTINNITVVYGP